MDWSDFVVADFQKLEREARICRKMQVLALKLNFVFLSFGISIYYFLLIDGFIIFLFDFTVSTFIFNKYFISISFHIPAHENYICLLSWFLFVFPADLYLSCQLIVICLLSWFIFVFPADLYLSSQHPNIVRLHDGIQEESFHYLVFDL